jgi:hypothetical protein
MDAAVNNAIQANQTSLESQIQFAVARKSLDSARIQGEALAQLIEVAAQIGKAVGAGEQFDAMG